MAAYFVELQLSSMIIKYSLLPFSAYLQRWGNPMTFLETLTIKGVNSQSKKFPPLLAGTLCRRVRARSYPAASGDFRFSQRIEKRPQVYLLNNDAMPQVLLATLGDQ